MSATGAFRRALADLPVLVVALLLSSTAADILPGHAIVGVGQVDLSLARVLLLAGFAALAVTAGPRALLVRTGLAIPIVLLLAVSLYTSQKWGTYPRYRFLVEGVAAFYLAAAVVRSRADARDAIVAIGLVALSTAALSAVAQVAQDARTGFYRVGCTPVTKAVGAAPHDGITRATGTFANPNVLAGYLLLIIPVGALAAAFVDRLRGMWVVVGTAVALGYLAVVFTFSRGAVLAAIVAAAAGILLSGSRHRRYLLLLVALAFGAVVLVLAGRCGSSATAGYGRADEWRQTFEVIKDNPLWGVGLGRLGDVLHAQDMLSSARHAHNLWLTWWAEAGPGALVAWIWIALALLWRSLRGALRGDRLALAGFVALLGFFGFSLLDHPANVDRVALAFWIVAGAVCGVTATARRSSGRLGALRLGQLRPPRRAPHR